MLHSSGILQAGTSTGRDLGSIVGSNLAAYTAELGGKVRIQSSYSFYHGDTDIWQAPIVVFNDADLLSAVNGVAFASFVASGQTCVSGARIIVQDQIYDEFLHLFLQKVDSITQRMGNRACFIISFIHSCESNQISSQSGIHHGLRDIHSAPGAD